MDDQTGKTEMPDSGAPQDQPDAPSENHPMTNGANPSFPASNSDQELRLHRPQPVPKKVAQKAAQKKDRSNMIIVGTLIFLAVATFSLVWTNIESTRPTRTRDKEAPLDLLPLEQLVHATSVKELAKDQWELNFDFVKAAKEGDSATAALLKDWKGRINPIELRAKHGRHAPIKVEQETKLPFTPLFSQISFQYDLHMEVEIEILRKCSLFIFFNYFYNNETTGTALRISPDGTAVFERYRREFRCNYPSGTPGRLVLEPGQKYRLYIKVTDMPHHAGYQCIAGLEDQTITSGEFLPEWPKDRRYLHGSGEKYLQADQPVPPQSGFVAFATAPIKAARIHTITLRGTVAEYWRKQRSETKKILQTFEKPAKVEVVPTEEPGESASKTDGP